MKNLFCFCCFVLASSFGSFLFGQDKEINVFSVDTLQFPGEARMNRIPTDLGEHFLMPANCAKKPTNFISSSMFVFPISSVGKIDSCSVTYELLADTIQRVTLTIAGEKHIQQAMRQTKKQFGKTEWVQKDDMRVASWDIFSRNKKHLFIRMEVSDSDHSGCIAIAER